MERGDQGGGDRTSKGISQRCADASAVLEHSFLLCVASVSSEQSGESWREEGTGYTGKKHAN